MKHPKTAKELVKKLINDFGLSLNCPKHYGLKKDKPCLTVSCRKCWLSAIKDLK